MSKKIRTLIVIDNMNTGGIATSLYNFLLFQSQKMICDVLVFDMESVDKSKIPENVKIIDTPRILEVLGKSQSELNKKSKPLALIRIIMVIITRVFSGEQARRILLFFTKKRKGYDLAISYAHDNGWKSLSKGCNDYVLNKVEAKVKLSYVHCDYSNYGGYDRRQERMYDKFNYIALVSNSCKERFCYMFPKLTKKSIVIENYTNISKIRVLAEEKIDEFDLKEDYFVSVCRLSSVKGLDRVIRVFYELKLEGYKKFRWIIVGGGPEYNRLNELVEKYGLKESIIFVGERENPYPYIKNAYAFLLPSIHEAAPMVYSESAVLGVPVITTETCSAIELVRDRKMGIVIENNQEEIKRVLRELLKGNIVFTDFVALKNNVNKQADRQVCDFINIIRETIK